jgi:hypothetical protein
VAFVSTSLLEIKRIYQRVQYEGPMRDSGTAGHPLAQLQGMADGSVTNVVAMQRAR